MPLSSTAARRIQRVLSGLQDLIASPKGKGGGKSAPAPRVRRQGKELEVFKKTLAAERKRGIPVSELAEKYGVTPSYIYQLPTAASAPAKTRKSAGTKTTRAKAITKAPKKARKGVRKPQADVEQPAVETVES